MFKLVMYDRNGLTPENSTLYLETKEEADTAASILNHIYEEDPSLKSDYTYVVENRFEEVAA